MVKTRSATLRDSLCDSSRWSWLSNELRRLLFSHLPPVFSIGLRVHSFGLDSLSPRQLLLVLWWGNAVNSKRYISVTMVRDFLYSFRAGATEFPVLLSTKKPRTYREVDKLVRVFAPLPFHFALAACDCFDTAKRIMATLRVVVMSVIDRHPDMVVYWLTGPWCGSIRCQDIPDEFVMTHLLPVSVKAALAYASDTLLWSPVMVKAVLRSDIHTYNSRATMAFLDKMRWADITHVDTVDAILHAVEFPPENNQVLLNYCTTNFDCIPNEVYSCLMESWTPPIGATAKEIDIARRAVYTFFSVRQATMKMMCVDMVPFFSFASAPPPKFVVDWLGTTHPTVVADIDLDSTVIRDASGSEANLDVKLWRTESGDIHGFSLA